MRATSKRKTTTPRAPARRSESAVPVNNHHVEPIHSAVPSVAYFNRELSWLAFNRRVLEQAENPKNPLLERVKFLAIVSSNLDEFFEIRVSGLIQQVDAAAAEPSLDGLGARGQLRRIHSVVASLGDAQYDCGR